MGGLGAWVSIRLWWVLAFVVGFYKNAGYEAQRF
jgi:hypothetical protein